MSSVCSIHHPNKIEISEENSSVWLMEKEKRRKNFKKSLTLTSGLKNFSSISENIGVLQTQWKLNCKVSMKTVVKLKHLETTCKEKERLQKTAAGAGRNRSVP